MDADLLRLLSMLTQGGRGQAGPVTPPTQLPPDFAARQLLGGGMLGPTLANRNAQLADPTAVALAAAAQGAGAGAGGSPMPQVNMPPGGVFMRPDDPSTMNPAQLVAYMKAHNIKKPSAIDELMAFLAKASQPTTAAAGSGAKSLSSIYNGTTSTP
jgi:hypothetical protein